ncbi:MAG: hypothetical protein PHG82_04840 [Candidatus Gracilibacteria bacterium]|nr:hypothetical protein [Candidatus Gracilibacteria bacterium]
MNSIKDITYNTAIFVNSDSACENNCPGCRLGVKEADLSKKLPLSELKNRIDYLSENINYGGSLIFQPGNILLEYKIDEIEELFTYTSEKTNKLIQWEIAKLDSRILDFLESEKIKSLIQNQKLCLNVGYLVKDLKLLKEIFAKVFVLGRENRKNQIIKEGFQDDFLNLSDEEYLQKLSQYANTGKINENENRMLFSIHNLGNLDNNIDDFWNFIDFCGFDPDKNELKYAIENHTYFSSLESGVSIQFIYLEENKIVDGTVVWATTYQKGEERCILNDGSELDILGDGTISFHTNPCNSIALGNIKESTGFDVEKAFEEHKIRISNILIKYSETENFNQSQLCKKCLNGENPEVSFYEELKFFVKKDLKSIKKKIFRILSI